MRNAVLLCLVVGCGSSASKPRPEDPHQAELRAAQERDKRIEAMKPASPYIVKDTAVYRPTDACGQGPYRLETDTLHTAYGERLYVYACGKHAIQGNYRITNTHKGSTPSTKEASFGFSRENGACTAHEVTTTTAGSSGGTGVGPRASGGRSNGPAIAAPATLKPVALERATAIPADCVRTQVINTSTVTTGGGLTSEWHIQIDLWSDVPNDLDGLVFVVERSNVRPDMTPEGWAAFIAAGDAYHAAYMANLEVNVKSGRTRILDSKVTAPAPPPPRVETQPPRPSQNARWIPGYWLYEDASFHWLAGLWEVPEADVQRALTVQAPTPPPAEPARDEPTDPAPVRAAVWTPGSWQWDGRAYVWIAGAWRLPPDENHAWQRPTWSVRSGCVCASGAE
jgi:hypothetical protein